MRISFNPYYLKFKHPFGVSGNTREQTVSIFLQIEHEGVIGHGEACLPEYLGETPEHTISFFKKAEPLLHHFNDGVLLEDFLYEIDQLSIGNNAAKAAIDIALCDYSAKKMNLSFTGWKGIQHKTEMSTSFTIGIDKEEKIAQKILEAKDFEVLKIKAGTNDDQSLISTIRKYTDKPLYVDVNQGWKDEEKALKLIEWMLDKNVLLIEQPLPKAMHKQMRWLTARSPIPTFADESIKRLKDLKEMDGAFSGVNIKLMKCTGLIEALKMIDYCKQNQIKIFLGCMAESSCATAAMAQLMVYADFIDLDAPQLYLNDPFSGINYEQGKIIINQLRGIGVKPNDNFANVGI